MSPLLVFVHVVCLASFLVPIVVAFRQWVLTQAPLALTFLKMNLSMMVFLIFLFFGFVLLELFPQNNLEIEIFQHSVFFLLYSLLFVYVSRFLFELQQWPWAVGLKILTYALAGLGPVMLFSIHALVIEAGERERVLQFYLQSVYVPVFLLWFLGLFGTALVRRKNVSDGWKRSTIAGAGLCFLLGSPLFVIDMFWEYFQLKWKIIPRGLNTHIVVYFAWNLYFMLRWIEFARQTKGGLEPQLNPQEWDLTKLHPLTAREKQIVGAILKGMTNLQIAETLQITVATTKTHIYNVFNKIGASSRKELRNLLSLRSAETQSAS